MCNTLHLPEPPLDARNAYGVADVLVKLRELRLGDGPKQNTLQKPNISQEAHAILVVRESKSTRLPAGESACHLAGRTHLARKKTEPQAFIAFQLHRLTSIEVTPSIKTSLKT